VCCFVLGFICVFFVFSFFFRFFFFPSPEVQALMELLGEYIRQERRKIMDNNIRLTAIGHLDRLPPSTHQSLTELIEITKENTGMTLCLALSYGGREEILAATGALCAELAAGQLRPEAIDEKAFTARTWSGSLGPVDLIIRTSGEQRLSNFLLWSCAYAELHFTDRMWPEFDESDLDKALADFASRQRRYGEVTEHD